MPAESLIIRASIIFAFTIFVLLSILIRMEIGLLGYFTTLLFVSTILGAVLPHNKTLIENDKAVAGWNHVYSDGLRILFFIFAVPLGCSIVTFYMLDAVCSKNTCDNLTSIQIDAIGTFLSNAVKQMESIGGQIEALNLRIYCWLLVNCTLIAISYSLYIRSNQALLLVTNTFYVTSKPNIYTGVKSREPKRTKFELYSVGIILFFIGAASFYVFQPSWKGGNYTSSRGPVILFEFSSPYFFIDYLLAVFWGWIAFVLPMIFCFLTTCISCAHLVGRIRNFITKT